MECSSEDSRDSVDGVNLAAGAPKLSQIPGDQEITEGFITWLYHVALTRMTLACFTLIRALSAETVTSARQETVRHGV